MDPVRVLFVCLGNICRSPMAEALFRHHVIEAGLADRFEIDSAGTGSWHIGSPPHPDTQEQLRLNNIAVGLQRARQAVVDDAETFDYIVAMDDDNATDLARLFGAAADSTAVSRLLEHTDAGVLDVPDPYHAGGYDRVYELVDAGTLGLLAFICAREGLTGHA